MISITAKYDIDHITLRYYWQPLNMEFQNLFQYQNIYQ